MGHSAADRLRRLMKHPDKAFAIGEGVLAPWERKGQRN